SIRVCVCVCSVCIRVCLQCVCDPCVFSAVASESVKSQLCSSCFMTPGVWVPGGVCWCLGVWSRCACLCVCVCVRMCMTWNTCKEISPPNTTKTNLSLDTPMWVLSYNACVCVC